MALPEGSGALVGGTYGAGGYGDGTATERVQGLPSIGD